MKPRKKKVFPPINKYTKEYKTLIRKYKMNIVYYLPGELYDKLINHYEKLIDDFASSLYKNNKICKSFKCKIFLVDKDDVNASCKISVISSFFIHCSPFHFDKKENDIMNEQCFVE